MNRFFRFFSTLSASVMPLAAAVFLTVSLTACDGGNSVEDSKAYSEVISPRHDLLARSIILQGRMIERINLNPEIINEEDFYNAEDLLDGWMKELGTEEALEALELPGDSSQVKDLHETFITSVANLRQAREVLEEGLYTQGATPAAEAYWKVARQAFMDFTRDLNEAVGGEPLPEVKEEEEPAAPKVGDHMIMPAEEPM